MLKTATNQWIVWIGVSLTTCVNFTQKCLKISPILDFTIKYLFISQETDLKVEQKPENQTNYEPKTVSAAVQTNESQTQTVLVRILIN